MELFLMVHGEGKLGWCAKVAGDDMVLMLLAC